jgi:hypothetical protein
MNHITLNPVPGKYNSSQTVSAYFSSEVDSVIYDINNPNLIFAKYIAYDTLTPPNPFIAVVEDGKGNVLFDGGFPKWYNMYCNSSWSSFSNMSASFKYLYNALYYIANPIKLDQGNRKVLVLGDKNISETNYVIDLTNSNGFKTSIDTVCRIAGFTPTYKRREQYSSNMIDCTLSELDEYCCVLLFSTNYTSNKLITDSAIQALINYREKGNGIFIITDHGDNIYDLNTAKNGAYVGFFRTANYLVTNFNAWFSGNYYRTDVNVGFLRQNYGDHPLYNNLNDSEYIHAGDSESRVFIPQITSYTSTNFPTISINKKGYTNLSFMIKLKDGKTITKNYVYKIDVNEQDGSVSNDILKYANIFNNIKNTFDDNHRLVININSESKHINKNNFKSSANLVSKDDLSNDNNLNIPFSSINLNVPDKKIKSFSNDFLPVNLITTYDGSINPYRATNYYIYDKQYKKFYELRIGSSSETGDQNGGWNKYYLYKTYIGVIDNIDSLATLRTTSLEYRPQFLTNSEFIDWIYDGNEYGFLCRIRSKEDNAKIKYYFILHNDSGDPFNHTYIDVTDLKNNYSLDSLLYYPDDDLYFGLKGVSQATYYVFDSNYQLVNSYTGILISLSSSDCEFINNSNGSIPDAASLIFNHTHRNQLHIFKDNNGKFLINRTVGVLIYTVNAYYLRNYKDYIIYDPNSNTFTDQNNVYKPIKFYYPTHQDYYDIVKYGNMYWEVRKLYFFSNLNRFLHYKKPGDHFDMVLYSYELSNSDPYYISNHFLDISSFGTLKSSLTYEANDQSYIGKGVTYTSLLKFNDTTDHKILTKGSSKKYGTRTVAVTGFNENIPNELQITNITDLGTTALDYNSYLDYTGNFRLYSYTSNSFEYCDNYNDFINGNFTTYHTHSINTNNLLYDLITNYSEDSTATNLQNQNIYVLPYLLNNQYYIVYYGYLIKSDIRTYKMYCVLLDTNLNVVKHVKLKEGSSSSYSSFTVKWTNANAIYESGSSLYIAKQYLIYTPGGNNLVILVHSIDKSNLNITFHRAIGTSGTWNRQNLFINPYYGLCYTTSFPYNATKLYYSADLNNTNFDSKMIDSFVNRSFSVIDPLIQARGSTSFTIGWDQFLATINGKVINIAADSIDLHNIVSDPSNKTFYIYFEIDNDNINNSTFRAYISEQQETENRIFFATCYTDNVGVYSVLYVGNSYFIDKFKLNKTLSIEPNSILVSQDGTIPTELFDTNFDTNNDLRFVKPYETTITLNSGQYQQFDLYSIFNVTSVQATVCHIYVLDNNSGSIAQNKYVKAEAICTVAKTSDNRYIRVYNNDNVPRTFRILIEI